ncbi:MAG: PKD domain-containing protein [Bacteroidales bacterium]|nr:PKD domain-containing protein [Bacteroidales bacterium]
MKTVITPLLFFIFTLNGICQQSTSIESNKAVKYGSMERVRQPGQDYPDYPRLQLSQKSSLIELPAVVDNSNQPYLRPVFLQQGASCEQSASVAYNFCYEINRMRGLHADTNINQYPSHFVWNFMTAATDYWGGGVNYFHTFDILYDAGTPAEAIYGSIWVNDSYRWMTGYDGYFQAMHNRISGVSSIYTGTPDGLMVLKHWLNDHLDGSETGGVANYTAGQYYGLKILPEGTPEAGKHVHDIFGDVASHAMTIVGYNDSIRIDLNGDGLYTNHLDITGDTLVDMCDWEIGGVKMVNSYGDWWADSGFCYVLYRTLAMKYGEGGIWNNSVHVLYPDTAAKPLLTIKATIKYNLRGRIRLLAGITTDTSEYFPTNTMSFSHFNFQGGDFNMTGSPETDGETLELGLDITPLLSYSKSGEPFRIFLIIEEKDAEGWGDGYLLNYSVMSYLNTEPVEFISPILPLAIVDNEKTVASIIVDSGIVPVEIQPDETVFVPSGMDKTIQFSATGGFPPYTWALKQIINETESLAPYSPAEGTALIPTNTESGFATVPLPFSFPFYGNNYDTLYMNVNGYLLFDQQDMPYHYLLYDENYLRQVRAVAGYMNHELFLHSASDYISYNTYTDSLVFNWKISDQSDNNTVIFSTTIFKDGQIAHHYGSIGEPGKMLPVIGMSDGKSESTYYSRYNGTVPVEGKIIRFIPSSLPDEIAMSNEGMLTIEANAQPFSDKIIIQAHDSQRIFNEKSILMTSGLEMSLGLANSDTIIPPGSVLPLSITLINHGDETITSLSVDVHTVTPNASVIGNDISGIDLLPGQTMVVDDLFSLQINDTLSKPQLAGIEVSGTTNDFVFHTYRNFQIDLPVLVFSPIVVDDGNNFIPEPGEEADLLFRIFNYGKVSAGRFTLKASIEDPFAGLSGPTTIDLGELKGLSMCSAKFHIKINTNTPLNKVILLRMEIENDDNPLIIKEFFLTIGEPSIALIDMDGNHNSSIHIASAINELNLNVNRFVSITDELLNYDILFLSLGFLSDNYNLTTSEINLLVEFLDNGGNLYVEAGPFYIIQATSLLAQRLMVNGLYDAIATPSDTLIGLAGTPVEDFNFDYRGDSLFQANLQAIEPAVPWLSDKNSGLNFTVALNTGNYRTIASSVEFGGISPIEGPNKTEMIKRYLDFFGYQTNLLAANFKADSTFICKGSVVRFEPLCNGTPTTFHWIFEGGTPSEYEGPYPVITYETEGYFGVTLTVSDGQTSNTFSLENFIMVDQCIGIPEEKYPTLVLYPNPANEMITIRTGTLTGYQANVLVSDLSGRVVLRQAVAAGLTEIQLPVSTLRPGCYLITYTDTNHRQSAVMIR